MPQDSNSLFPLFGALRALDLDGVTVRDVVQRTTEILVIVLVALILSRVAARVARRSVRGVVARSVRVQGEQASARATVRAETLAGVSASFIRIWIWSVAVLTALGRVGLDLGPLLAGASIVGVAIGFGAQSLVKDFLSGFFVLAEDQFGVGDSVTVADVTGTVEEVNLRITRIRAFDGTIWFVPNGEIRKVGNSAKEWARAVVDTAIPSGADLAAAMTAIAEEISHLSDEDEWANRLLEAPEVLGVETTATDSFTIRVAAKTQPTERAKVARELRARIGRRLRSEGVIPLREPAPDEEPAGASDAPG